MHLEQGERAVRNARAIGFNMGVAHLPIAPSAAPSPEARGTGGEDQRRVLTLLCLHGHSRHDRHSARAHDGGWVSGACASQKHVGRPLLGPAHEMGWMGQETGGRRPTSTKKSILVLVPCSPDRGGVRIPKGATSFRRFQSLNQPLLDN